MLYTAPTCFVFFITIGHSLLEVRTRAIDSALFKLENHLLPTVDIIAQPEFVNRLAESLTVCDGHRSDEIIQTLETLLSDDAIHGSLQRCGTSVAKHLADFQQKQKQKHSGSSSTSSSCTSFSTLNAPETKTQTGRIETLLAKVHHIPAATMNVQLPPLPPKHIDAVDLAQSQSQSRSQPAPDFRSSMLASKWTSDKTVKAAIDDHTQKFELAHGWRFPAVPLISADGQVLFELCSRLQSVNRNTCLDALRTLEFSILPDFPSEVLIERPELIQSIMSVVGSPRLLHCDIAAVRCLELLIVRLQDATKLFLDPMYRGSSRGFEYQYPGALNNNGSNSTIVPEELKSDPWTAASVERSRRSPISVQLFAHNVMVRGIALLRSPWKASLLVPVLLQLCEILFCACTIDESTRERMQQLSRYFADLNDVLHFHSTKEMAQHPELLTIAELVLAIGDAFEQAGGSNVVGLRPEVLNQRLADMAMSDVLTVLYPELQARLWTELEQCMPHTAKGFELSQHVIHSIRTLHKLTDSKSTDATVSSTLQSIAGVRRVVDALAFQPDAAQSVLQVLFAELTSSVVQKSELLRNEGVAVLLALLQHPHASVRLVSYVSMLECLRSRTASSGRHLLWFALHAQVVSQLIFRGLFEKELAPIATKYIAHMTVTFQHQSQEAFSPFYPVVSLFATKFSAMASLCETVRALTEPSHVLMSALRFMFHPNASMRSRFVSLIQNFTCEMLRETAAEAKVTETAIGPFLARIQSVQDPCATIFAPDADASENATSSHNNSAQASSSSSIEEYFDVPDVRQLIQIFEDSKFELHLRVCAGQQLLRVLSDVRFRPMALSASLMQALVREIQNPGHFLSLGKAVPYLNSTAVDVSTDSLNTSTDSDDVSMNIPTVLATAPAAAESATTSVRSTVLQRAEMARTSLSLLMLIETIRFEAGHDAPPCPLQSHALATIALPLVFSFDEHTRRLALQFVAYCSFNDLCTAIRTDKYAVSIKEGPEQSFQLRLPHFLKDFSSFPFDATFDPHPAGHNSTSLIDGVSFDLSLQELTATAPSKANDDISTAQSQLCSKIVGTFLSQRMHKNHLLSDDDVREACVSSLMSRIVQAQSHEEFHTVLAAITCMCKCSSVMWLSVTLNNRSYPWQEVLQRYLAVPPSTPSDIRLYQSALEFISSVVLGGMQAPQSTLADKRAILSSVAQFVSMHVAPQLQVVLQQRILDHDRQARAAASEDLVLVRSIVCFASRLATVCVEAVSALTQDDVELHAKWQSGDWKKSDIRGVVDASYGLVATLVSETGLLAAMRQELSRARSPAVQQLQYARHEFDCRYGIRVALVEFASRCSSLPTLLSAGLNKLLGVNTSRLISVFADALAAHQARGIEAMRLMLSYHIRLPQSFQQKRILRVCLLHLRHGLSIQIRQAKVSSPHSDSTLPSLAELGGWLGSLGSSSTDLSESHSITGNDGLTASEIVQRLPQASQFEWLRRCLRDRESVIATHALDLCSALATVRRTVHQIADTDSLLLEDILGVATSSHYCFGFRCAALQCCSNIVAVMSQELETNAVNGADMKHNMEQDTSSSTKNADIGTYLLSWVERLAQQVCETLSNVPGIPRQLTHSSSTISSSDTSSILEPALVARHVYGATTSGFSSCPELELHHMTLLYNILLRCQATETLSSRMRELLGHPVFQSSLFARLDLVHTSCAMQTQLAALSSGLLSNTMLAAYLASAERTPSWSSGSASSSTALAELWCFRRRVGVLKWTNWAFVDNQAASHSQSRHSHGQQVDRKLWARYWNLVHQDAFYRLAGRVFQILRVSQSIAGIAAIQIDKYTNSVLVPLIAMAATPTSSAPASFLEPPSCETNDNDTGSDADTQHSGSPTMSPAKVSFAASVMKWMKECFVNVHKEPVFCRTSAQLLSPDNRPVVFALAGLFVHPTNTQAIRSGAKQFEFGLVSAACAVLRHLLLQSSDSAVDNSDSASLTIAGAQRRSFVSRQFEQKSMPALGANLLRTLCDMVDRWKASQDPREMAQLRLFQNNVRECLCAVLIRFPETRMACFNAGIFAWTLEQLEFFLRLHTAASFPSSAQAAMQPSSITASKSNNALHEVVGYVCLLRDYAFELSHDDMISGIIGSSLRAVLAKLWRVALKHPALMVPVLQLVCNIVSASELIKLHLGWLSAADASVAAVVVRQDTELAATQKRRRTIFHALVQFVAENDPSGSVKDVTPPGDFIAIAPSRIAWRAHQLSYAILRSACMCSSTANIVLKNSAILAATLQRIRQYADRRMLGHATDLVQFLAGVCFGENGRELVFEACSASHLSHFLDLLAHPDWMSQCPQTLRTHLILLLRNMSFHSKAKLAFGSSTLLTKMVVTELEKSCGTVNDVVQRLRPNTARDTMQTWLAAFTASGAIDQHCLAVSSLLWSVMYGCERAKVSIRRNIGEANIALYVATFESAAQVLHKHFEGDVPSEWTWVLASHRNLGSSLALLQSTGSE
jgi:hypothetical protein